MKDATGLHQRLSLLEEPRVDPLADDDVGKLQLVISEASGPEAVLDCGDLMLHHVRDLSVAHPIPVQYDNEQLSHHEDNSLPVHDDSAWQVPVDLGIFPEGLGNGWTHIVVQFLKERQ